MKRDVALNDLLALFWIDYNFYKTKYKDQALITENSVPLVWHGDVNRYFSTNGLSVVTASINPSSSAFLPEKGQLSEEEKEYKSKRKMIQEKLIKFATRIPIFMYLTDYREYSLKDVITQLEPGLFKRVTGLDVKDFELLVSLGVFNGPLMNDAVYKFKRYEDSSLSYTGINKHEGEKVGGFDTVLNADEYRQLYGEQQKSLQSKKSSIKSKKIEPTKPVISSPSHKKETPVTTTKVAPISTPIKQNNGGSENNQDLNDVVVGTRVEHDMFGEGLVKAIMDDKIIVSFGKSEKMFIYPDAFKKKFLKLK